MVMLKDSFESLELSLSGTDPRGCPSYPGYPRSFYTAIYNYPLCFEGCQFWD